MRTNILGQACFVFKKDASRIDISVRAALNGFFCGVRQGARSANTFACEVAYPPTEPRSRRDGCHASSPANATPITEEAKMLSPHEFPTLMLFKDPRAQEELNRAV